MEEIDIKGLDKFELFKALYDNAQVIGLGGLAAKQGEMDIEEAKRVIGQYEGGNLYFDYVYGRVMKVNLSGDTLDPSLYDRDNGGGSAKFAIDKLRGVESDNPQEPKFRAEKCQLNPMLIVGIAMGKDDSPCDGCNMDRSVCNGGPNTKG